MRTLLALRGVDKRSNVEAWEQGKLTVAQGSLKIQGVAQTWRNKVEKGETWNIDKQPIDGAIRELEPNASETIFSEVDGGSNTPVTQPSQLREIICCRCIKVRQPGNAKLFTKTGFSLIKCPSKFCGTAVPSDKWLCRCRIPWIKCPRHVHIAAVVKSKEKSPEQIR